MSSYTDQKFLLLGWGAVGARTLTVGVAPGASSRTAPASAVTMCITERLADV